MTTIGVGDAARAGVVGRVGVGEVAGGATDAGCGVATGAGLRFVVGRRFVCPSAADERASKTIRGKGLSFILELMVVGDYRLVRTALVNISA